jgi:hypothetical protein
MIITWKPIGSKKPAIEYKQPEKDVLSIDGDKLDLSWSEKDGVFTIPQFFINYVHKAERIGGVLYLELLYRCDGNIKEPDPIDYGETEVLTWKE